MALFREEHCGERSTGCRLPFPDPKLPNKGRMLTYSRYLLLVGKTANFCKLGRRKEARLRSFHRRRLLTLAIRGCCRRLSASSHLFWTGLLGFPRLTRLVGTAGPMSNMEYPLLQAAGSMQMQPGGYEAETTAHGICVLKPSHTRTSP